jgi:hypothetical protein
MNYFCCDERRRAALHTENQRRQAAGQPLLNGIDYLEVLDRDAPMGVERQRTLLVRLFAPVGGLNATNIRLEGGERVNPVRVEWAQAATAAGGPFATMPDPNRLLVVRTDSTGDYSTYRFALLAQLNANEPPAGFDPMFSAVDFSFKVECPSDFDCHVDHICRPPTRPTPLLDYLAKDYESFRRLMLDRMALLAPQWTERSAADQGVALVETLAYVADHLSYQQDAIGTEAYLGTARRRVSVRRHARFVDYRMHDGCSARVWVQVWCEGTTVGVSLPRGTPLFTRVLPEAGSF